MAVSPRLLAVIALAMASPAMAQSPTTASIDRDGPATPAVPDVRAKPLTGKERLGDKSTDEQRLDNCKVPTEKQGVRKRSGTCDHLRIGMTFSSSTMALSVDRDQEQATPTASFAIQGHRDSPSSEKTRI